MSAEQRVTKLNIELPAAPKSVGLYQTIVTVDALAYLSGHLPLQADGSIVQGRLGDGFDVQAGYQAARLAGLATLATLREHLGSLDRVNRLVKTFGLVRSVSDFAEQPAVINGFSELMRDVFGPERGVGARSAVGTNSLPIGSVVEIETIFEIQ